MIAPRKCSPKGIRWSRSSERREKTWKGRLEGGIKKISYRTIPGLRKERAPRTAQGPSDREQGFNRTLREEMVRRMASSAPSQKKGDAATKELEGRSKKNKQKRERCVERGAPILED